MLDFFIEEIGVDRIEELLEMLREREAWLEERGMPLWDAAKLNRDRLVQRYPGARYFLILLDDVPAGGFLLAEGDDRYWLDCDRVNAYYFHKFVLKPEFSGQGFADRALDWVIGFAEAKGKDFVRLDYDEARPKIADLYKRHGFVPQRVIDFPDDPDCVKMVTAQRAL